MIRGPGANSHQLRARKRRQQFFDPILMKEIPANQAAIGLADFNEWLTSTVMGNAYNVEAFIRLSVSEQWNM
jgi:hypothetical protein